MKYIKLFENKNYSQIDYKEYSEYNNFVIRFTKDDIRFIKKSLKSNLSFDKKVFKISLNKELDEIYINGNYIIFYINKIYDDYFIVYYNTISNNSRSFFKCDQLSGLKLLITKLIKNE